MASKEPSPKRTFQEAGKQLFGEDWQPTAESSDVPEVTSGSVTPHEGAQDTEPSEIQRGTSASERGSETDDDTEHSEAIGAWAVLVADKLPQINAAVTADKEAFDNSEHAPGVQWSAVRARRKALIGQGISTEEVVTSLEPGHVGEIFAAAKEIRVKEAREKRSNIPTSQQAHSPQPRQRSERRERSAKQPVKVEIEQESTADPVVVEVTPVSTQKTQSHESSLYTVDDAGRAHRGEGASGRGAFISANERGLIDEHEEMIEARANVQQAAHRAYNDAIQAGLDEAAANAAAEAVYHGEITPPAAVERTDSSVDALTEALEQGRVNAAEAAAMIATLTAERDQLATERDALLARLTTLEQQVETLSQRLEGSGEGGGAGGTGEGGDDTGRELPPPQGREAALRDARESLGDTREYRNLEAALGSYAELKATSETKGKWFGGRKKRNEALLQAESRLLEAKIAFEQLAIERAGANGMYGEDEAAANEQRSDDMFDAIRGLDRDTRQRVNAVHERNMEQRNWLTKKMIGVGNWLTKGGKFGQAMKAGGSGLVAGAGVGLVGLGFPITSAIGAGLGLGVRGMAVAANLDRIRGAENKDAEGHAKTALSDEDVSALKQEFDRAHTAPAERARVLAERIFETSRKRGYEQADRARRQANWTMGKFGLGFAAGAFAGNYIHDAYLTAHAGDVPGGGGGEDVSSVIEFSKGASTISSGEGWYSQFVDMGMTHKEARELFRDKELMNKLVDMGVAYVDKSPRIGGYGILMPKGGHLANEAMQLIGTAMKARGF